jgi:hypothetical protein
MQTLHWLILGGLGLAILLILKATFIRPNLGKIACSVRQSYCSRERRQFWLALQEAVGEDYLVLANVPLPTLLAAPDEGGEPLQEWLRQRWADFAILHQKHFTPTAIVQFERGEGDPSPWQPGRDQTLERIAARAGLTLLWLPSDRYQHIELLRHALDQAKARAQAAAGNFKEGV